MQLLADPESRAPAGRARAEAGQQPGEVLGAGQGVPLGVVAGPVGGDQVVQPVVGVAGLGDEVVHLDARGAPSHAAVEARAVLRLEVLGRRCRLVVTSSFSGETTATALGLGGGHAHRCPGAEPVFGNVPPQALRGLSMAINRRRNGMRDGFSNGELLSHEPSPEPVSMAGKGAGGRPQPRLSVRDPCAIRARSDWLGPARTDASWRIHAAHSG